MRCKTLHEYELDFSLPQYLVMAVIRWGIDTNRALLDSYNETDVNLNRSAELINSSQAGRLFVNSVPLLSHIESIEEIILGQYQNENECL